jgi:superfamily I DNA and RNA helicase
MHEEVRPLRSIGRPPAVRRYKVETQLRTEDADMHTAGIRTQIEAILGELDPQEKLSDLLFLIPSRKSPTYTALRSALESLEVASIDFTVKANRDTTARDHQVRISTFHSCRGVEASIVVLLDLERLAERKNARQQLYIGLTRAVRLAIVLEPDIAVSQLATLLERAAACINAASTQQDFKKNLPQRPVKQPQAPAKLPAPNKQAATETKNEESAQPNDDEIIHIEDTDNDDVEAEPNIDEPLKANDPPASEPTRDQEKDGPLTEQGQTEPEEPRGFGTSIFAAMADKAKRGKQINAIYDWSTFIDVSAE